MQKGGGWEDGRADGRRARARGWARMYDGDRQETGGTGGRAVHRQAGVHVPAPPPACIRRACAGGRGGDGQAHDGRSETEREREREGRREIDGGGERGSE